ncbi:hypothetical protein [Cohnella phaseoli]|uniref:Uncharacterized protein n=1 Tax=Cohnella phaseoli TaxID=456490 RepID=A0A3D9JPS2_9BACL|nr:hypothetical protein [Cohnella phaseoli]RED76024.1 hypothetical protein DFP98_11384 [Cohnella phaseoli]
MDDLLMFFLLGCIGYIMYRGITGKPILPFLANRKKKDTDQRSVKKIKELKGDFKELIGLKDIHGNLLELIPENNIRTFVGAIKCRPINYDLRSLQEQIETDNRYEELLAKLSLGPGREVKFAIHVQSRPIELIDQLKQYHENFKDLNEIAQRYAQSMFYPFLEQWQNSVDEFSYSRYFFLILDYSPKMLEGLDEDSILAKAQNEFLRLSGNVISSYSLMGGASDVCDAEGQLESLYFATHKRNASIETIRSILNRPGRLSNVVTSNYEREPFRVIDDMDELGDEIA